METIVTISTDFKKATFTWDNAFENCHMTAIGFSDEEINEMMEAGAHEGVDFKDYICTMV